MQSNVKPVNLSALKGDTKQIVLTVSDDAGAVDLSGHTIALKIYSADDTLLQTIAGTGSLAGAVAVTISATISNGLPGATRFEVLATLGSVVTTLLWGRLTTIQKAL